MGSDVDMGSDLFDAVVGPVWPGADDVVARLGAGEPERLRDMAVAAVDSVAADVAAAWRDGVTARVKSSAHDVVTQTDIDTEARLIALLRERTPEAVFLGEEGANKAGVGTEGSSADTVCWVIDPIDGTSNFVHGLPDFGISVAAVVDG
ncbi:inositol monophosphatase family protein, partial [Staphylococcus aureus]